MPRRFNISIAVFAVAISAAAFAASGNGSKKNQQSEDSGCHLDDITDSYFCSSGPLEGREFLTKSELDDALEAYRAKAKDDERERPDEALPPPTADSPLLKDDKAEATSAKADKTDSAPKLKIMSWNMKALAGEGSDYDRAAMVLAQADVVALQEVDTRGQGKGFLNVIGNLIQAKTQQKVCRAWVQGGNGERQAYGFLWRESTVGYVDAEGTINENCGDTATVIKQVKKNRLASQATFYFKAQKKMFVLGTAFMDKKPKSPEKSINELFKSLEDGKWPVVFAGDLKLSAGNSAFNGVRKLGFHSAIGGANAKAWDNVWYRGVSVGHAGPVDLYHEFADARREDIQKDFSGIFPVMAEFNLRDDQVADTVAIVSKTKPAPPKKKKRKQKQK